jgi:hypothetical protein
MFPLSGGIRRGVNVAEVFLVRCWTVLASVLAAGLILCVEFHCMFFCPVLCIARHHKRYEVSI